MEERTNVSAVLVLAAVLAVVFSGLAHVGSARQNKQHGMDGARYALTNVWAIAARGEYLGDPDGYLTGVEGGALATGTLTLEAKPTKNLLLRLEQRGDFMLSADESAGATKDVFPKSVRDSASSQITTTFGVVVMTN